LQQDSVDSIVLRFEDGAELVIQKHSEQMKVTLHLTEELVRPRSATGPTSRQREYLDFIKKYLYRHGFSPAEADIQGHFMVTAPSVHQMIRTLERRGFITRDRDWFGQTVPRSIRVTWDG
jgi:SOS-response transcriptional repressor LexA